jgi:transposase
MLKKPPSLELPERLVAAALNGMSQRQAADRFSVSAVSAIRLFQRQKNPQSDLQQSW